MEEWVNVNGMWSHCDMKIQIPHYWGLPQSKPDESWKTAPSAPRSAGAYILKTDRLSSSLYSLSDSFPGWVWSVISASQPPSGRGCIRFQLVLRPSGLDESRHLPGQSIPGSSPAPGNDGTGRRRYMTGSRPSDNK